MINGLDLFSGIGGITLALSEWVKPITYCEIDRYAQAVLLSRMQDGLLSRAPIWDDVTTLDGKQFRGQIDIIYGGFPCQDISVAGNGKGLAGNRSWLFKEIMRLAEEIKPKFIFLENVPAIRTRGLEHVAEWLACSGYDCRWDFVSAQEVGAPHIRQRWFCLANANGNGGRIQPGRRKRACGKVATKSINDGSQEPLADSDNRRELQQTRGQRKIRDGVGISGEVMANASSIRGGARTIKGSRLRQQDDVMREDWWAVEPNVGRVVNGLSPELDFFIFESEENNVSSIETNDSQAIAETSLFNREVLRKMWEFKEIAASSPELYFRKLHDSLPTLPQRPTHLGENLGQRIQKGSELHNLWEKFYTASEQAEQTMWQSKLLKRVWEISCEETMSKSNRIDRIKGLGNAVVPAQTKEAFKRLIKIT